MRKALVTGGAGFIGSHLVDKLLKEGFVVKALDNLSQGKMSNIAHLKDERNFSFQECDLKDMKSIEKLIANTDVVFHLAAHANIRTSLVDHTADLENNLIGTLNVLEAMDKHKVRDLVFASTSALYGEAKARPTSEEYAPIQTSLYGASKLACEAYAEAYTEFTGINFWAYRFANIVGERCRRGVTWDFVNKLYRNPKELEILGDGKQSKEYLYVGDCIEGMMIGYSKSHNRTNIFNLAIEENSTPDMVADIVIREMGLKDVKREYTGGAKGWIGDIPVVHLSIDKIGALGWSPRVSSEESITRNARWAIQQLRKGND